VSKQIPRLMLVVESARSGLPLTELVAAAVHGGCDAIQIRDRALPREERRRRVETALRLAAGRTQVIVSDDVDLAAELGLPVHLPERSLAPATVRAILGEQAMIGRSVHSPGAAAASADVDYLVAGHVYATPSHPGETPLGLSGLAAIVRAASRPVLAIGGVTSERVPEILDAGAHGIAVIGAIAGTQDRDEATAAARALRAALEHRQAVV
jgi:thiamine-phosphate pyrophosphorylase